MSEYVTQFLQSELFFVITPSDIPLKGPIVYQIRDFSKYLKIFSDFLKTKNDRNRKFQRECLRRKNISSKLCPITVNNLQKVNPCQMKGDEELARNLQPHALKNWSAISFDPKRNIPARRFAARDRSRQLSTRSGAYTVRTCALRAQRNY